MGDSGYLPTNITSPNSSNYLVLSMYWKDGCWKGYASSTQRWVNCAWMKGPFTVVVGGGCDCWLLESQHNSALDDFLPVR